MAPEESLQKVKKQPSVRTSNPNAQPGHIRTQTTPSNSDLPSTSDFNTSILNDMNNISMVSFNVDEFGSSIMNEGGLDGINLMQIRETLHSRELKIKQLITDKQKLKALLVKAKAAISKINTQYKTATEEKRLVEQKLQHCDMEKQTMQKALEDMQKRRNGIEKSQVSQILARVKVGEIGYTLIQDVQHCCEWYRDNMIVHVQEQLREEWKTVQQVNYSTVFAEKKQLEDSLTLCMNQYEERLRRTNEYLEQSNQSYQQV